MKRDSSQDQRQSILDNKTFSPTNNSSMSNFFSAKGPIKAQNFYANQPSQSTQSTLQTKQVYHTQIPGASNMMNEDEDDDDDDEYYEEEDNDMAQKRDAVRIFTPEQEAMILKDLHMSAQKNTEFLKVLNILQNDPELRPLIFEHEALLSTLKGFGDLKAEQMLSILTAAETEMYENTRTKETQQMQQLQQNQTPTEHKSVSVNIVQADTEKEKLLETVKRLTKELDQIKQTLFESEQKHILICQELKIEKLHKETLEREQECAFNNLQEENKQLKKQNEAYKLNENQGQRTQYKIQQELEEIQNQNDQLQKQLKKQELQLKESNRNTANENEKQLTHKQNQINNLNSGLTLLENDNENLHRKMHQLYNQILFQKCSKQLNQTTDNVEDWTIIDKSINKEKYLVNSKHNNGIQNSQLYIDQSYIQHSQYYQQQQNTSLMKRSQSIDFIQLNYQQSNKQNQYEFGEEEISKGYNSSYQHSKVQQLQQKGLFNKIEKVNIQPNKSQLNIKDQLSQDQHNTLKKDLNDAQNKVQILQDQTFALTQENQSLKSLNNDYIMKIQQLQQQNVGKNYDQSFLMSPQRDQSFNLTQQNVSPFRQGHRLTMDNFQMSNLQSPIQPMAGDISQDRAYEQYQVLQNDFRQKLTEIGIKVDQVFEFQNRSRVMNPAPQYNQNYGYGFQNNAFSPTNLESSHFDLKNMFLEEKEKRLQTIEELNKQRELQIKYQQEIEKLRQELFAEKQNNQQMTVSQLDYHTHSNEQLNKHNQYLQQRLDSLQDENVSLKLKISEMEGELLDERQQKVMKYDLTIDNFKSSMQDQYLDYKIRFDEQMMTEKENNYKLRIEMQGLVERNQVLHEQLVQHRERIQELEKESVQQSKENYILQNELDYENIRSTQLQNKQSKIRDEIIGSAKQDQVKIDSIVNQNDLKLKEQQLKFQEQLLLKQRDIERMKISYSVLEEEIFKYKEDTIKLKNEISNYQLQNQKLSQQQINSFDKTNQDQQSFNKNMTQRLGALLISQGARYKQKLRFLYYFYKFKLLTQSNKQDQPFKSSRTKNSEAGDSEQRIMQLEEQLYKFQQQNTQLTMQIGRIIRASNQKQPIKLNLNGLVTKLGIDYLLSGLKNNIQVYELNLNNCGLDDEDLQKIGDKLRFDKGIISLKLGQNIFNNITPLLELIQLKAKQYEKIDISDSYLDQQSLGALCSVISYLEKIEDLNLSSIINKNNNSNQKNIKTLFDLLTTKKTLKSIDISKNKFQIESIEHLLTSLQRASNLEKLVISRIGLSDQITDKLLQTMKQLQNLKRLDISANNISSDKLSLIIQALKNNENLEDLDISKSNLKNDLTCCKELGVLIQHNIKLRQLVMIKSQLNDSSAYHLIQPISSSPNIEVIKLDFNQVGPVFIERLVKSLLQNKFTQSVNPNKNQNSQSSFYDDSDSSTVLDPKQARKQGLINISLEGNNIGDRGAKAIADLIRTPNDSTKNLKMINLNECGISNQGFEELRNALMQRASLASVSGLSHVKITIERNNIE